MEREHGRLKLGWLKCGVIMDVVNAEQAKIAFNGKYLTDVLSVLHEA